MGPPADLLDCSSGFQLGDLFVHVTGRDKALHTWNNVAVRQNGDKLFFPATTGWQNTHVHSQNPFLPFTFSLGRLFLWKSSKTTR